MTAWKDWRAGFAGVSSGRNLEGDSTNWGVTAWGAGRPEKSGFFERKLSDDLSLFPAGEDGKKSE